MSLSGHQSARMKNDEWLTPPEILGALGKFDLDPCSPILRPWPTATEHFHILDDGLTKPWAGRVWCNPPFGREAVKWLRRMAEHGNGDLSPAGCLREDCTAGYKHTHSERPGDWIVSPKKDGITDAYIERCIGECG